MARNKIRSKTLTTSKNMQVSSKMQLFPADSKDVLLHCLGAAAKKPILDCISSQTRLQKLPAEMSWFSKSDSSKVAFHGENFFPVTANDAGDKTSCAKEEQRVAEVVLALDPQDRRKRIDFICQAVQECLCGWLCLGFRGCLWWGRAVSQGWVFTEKIHFHASHHHSYWTYFRSLTSGHLGLCRIFFSSFCNTVVPFYPSYCSLLWCLPRKDTGDGRCLSW